MATERQEKYSAKVRTEILTAASRIVVQDGIQELSMRRVAHEIGYTVPLAYHYFHDKNHLLYTVVQEGYLNLINTTPEVKEDDPGEKLRKCFKSFVMNARKNPNGFKAALVNALYNPEHISGNKTIINSPTYKLILECVEALGIDNAELTAQVFWNSLYGSFFRLVLNQKLTETECEELIDRHTEILLNGIKRL